MKVTFENIKTIGEPTLSLDNFSEDLREIGNSVLDAVGYEVAGNYAEIEENRVVLNDTQDFIFRVLGYAVHAGNGILTIETEDEDTFEIMTTF